MSDLPFHPAANIFPQIEGLEFRELVEDVRTHGLREAIMLHDGMILDGRNRYRACQAAQVPCRFMAYGGPDPLAYVVSLNLRRRHLNESQRGIVAAKIANLPAHRPTVDKAANLPGFESPASMSQTAAADMLNVSERTVRAARSVLDHGTAALVEKVERGEVSVSAAADVARLPEAEQPAIVAMGGAGILARAKAIRGARAVLLVEKFTGNSEWYSPPNVVEAARRVLGKFDLDPASSEIAQRTIRATEFYTKESNGLDKPWAGLVWMNPPYAADLIGKFVSKLVLHVADGSVPAAIMLVDNRTDTQWFHEASRVASRICFSKGRVRFLRPGGDPGAPTNGSAFFYFGRDSTAFENVFSEIGQIMLPVRAQGAA